ncbi:MAG: Signal peptidase I [Rhodocyclaceae bacterium]|nr:MAG: signal peptidase I [Rhodocyclaceae bacterium]MBE7422084.1 signal peptidase I [Zoogloeaceae bacterium]MBV6408233.1 Signal peptidase I [Rhodocyclaceae bacterium]MCK6383573.1 signal peptidase I [Rhodocyclaceae bacterium]CAG0927001.1 signal peptidase I [Rhodocyclaceae bacterium]
MNFALILFLLTVATGAIWLFDVLLMKKRRRPDAKEPWWVEYGASFFPVILAVFLLRSFLVEPFKIPSGSMIPTLLVGDFILVNKFTYGIRLPVINKKVIDISAPQRGDVMVFRWPEDPSLDYIKRVVGLPGDKVAWRNKRLYINGNEVITARQPDYLHPDRLYYSDQYLEKFGTTEHRIILDKDAPAFVGQVMQFPGRDKCLYNTSGVTCEVPAGHYFVMGDNRDASSDSRVWGFVPDRNIVGKAFLIWFNFGDLKRIGSFQ